jgi:hypothetical protein
MKEITDTERLDFIIKYTVGIYTLVDDKDKHAGWDLLLIDDKTDVSSKYLRRSIDKAIKHVRSKKWKR